MRSEAVKTGLQQAPHRSLWNALGVTKEETMALGDNTNDALLLEHAGLAVSVANGVPSLKAISDYVCEAERSEGFDEAVRRFVLEPLTAPASDREETL